MIGIFVTTFVFLIFFLLILAEKIFEGTNYYKNNYSETNKLRGKDKVDYVNTGSTFAYYGIDYEAAGVKGLNLALRPQSLEYDYKMLKHFETRYNEGATIFIVVSDLAFAKKNYLEVDTNEKYYKVLDGKEIDGYNLLRAIRARYFPVLYNWKNFLRFYRDVRKDNEYDLKVNENDREAIEADTYKRCEAWMKEFGLKNLEDSGQKDRFNDAFCYTVGIISNMILWCKRKGYKPVIVNLPVSKELEKCFSQDFLDAFYYDNIRKAIGDGTMFINFQKYEKLTDYLLYLDSCRLNKSGREIITRLLIREAKKIR